MNKDLAIYNELSAAAAHVFSEGIDAPVGSYTLSELANIGNYKKAPKGVRCWQKLAPSNAQYLHARQTAPNPSPCLPLMRRRATASQLVKMRRTCAPHWLACSLILCLASLSAAMAIL